MTLLLAAPFGCHKTGARGVGTKPVDKPIVTLEKAIEVIDNMRPIVDQTLTDLYCGDAITRVRFDRIMALRMQFYDLESIIVDAYNTGASPGDIRAKIPEFMSIGEELYALIKEVTGENLLGEAEQWYPYAKQIFLFSIDQFDVFAIPNRIEGGIKVRAWAPLALPDC